MIVVGAEVLAGLLEGKVLDVKMVFNEHGAVLFPGDREHREMKLEGVSYEDNYAGNALAAMVRKDAIEIRYHKRFDDGAVARIVRDLLAQPAVRDLASVRVTYQGRGVSLR